MPKIIITGKDSTVAGDALRRDYNTAFIGVAISASTSVSAKEYVNETDFTDSLKDCPELTCAKYLVKNGMHVIYAQCSTDTALEDELKKMKDKNLYNVLFLYVKPLSNTEITNAKVIAVAKERGDCIAIFSEKDIDAQPSKAYDNGDYAGIFTPELKVSETVTIPAGLGYLMAYAKSVQTNPEYLAIAGINRGCIEGITGVEKDYTNAEIEALQGRTGDTSERFGTFSGSGINVISYRRGYGYRIWGSHTALDNSNGLKATSFLNCKVLVCIVKKVLYDVATQYQFEQNSDVLWYNIQSKITPVLDEMVRNNGISDYKFEKVATNYKARLEARLSLTPVEPLEDIKIEVELTDTIGVSDAQ